MNVKLLKTTSFPHTCALVQVSEDGKQHTSKLKVRFNTIPRDRWDEMSNSDDDRLLYDVVVNKIEDTVEVDDQVLSEEEARAAIRSDLSLTSQVVDQYLEVAFGAAAKNARRSRSR
jgi:hypothetical protein